MILNFAQNSWNDTKITVICFFEEDIFFRAKEIQREEKARSSA